MSISKVELQSPITGPALICLENVTVLSGGGGSIKFHFTSHFFLAWDDDHCRRMGWDIRLKMEMFFTFC